MAEKKSFKDLKMPNTFVILFFLIVLAAIGTHIIPAGLYERVTDPNTGRSIVDPATFHYIEGSPVSFFNTFVSIYKGMVNAADIIFFTLIAYSTFYLVLASGALNGAIGALLRVTKGRDRFVIPFFIYLFAFASAFFGIYEAAYGFIPVFVGLAIAMGYDAIVGMSVVSMGCGLGFAAAFMSPFTVGIAHKCAELPLFSGMWYRIVCWCIFVTMGTIWTARYAAKIRKDPSKSLMKGVNMGSLAMDYHELVNTKLTGRNKAVLSVLAVGMAILVWGVLTKGWFFNELCGILLITGIGCGVANGYSPSRIAEIFIAAWRDILFGACLIGLSRGILVVMQQGQVIDSIIHGLAVPLTYLPKWVAAEGMLVVQTLINFFIPSGSGQAATTIPIMAPLSDVLGISRQIAVLAFQFGDGFSNILWPTTGLPIMCSMAKVPIEKWWKFFVPFFFILIVAQVLLLMIAVMINYQ